MAWPMAINLKLINRGERKDQADRERGREGEGAKEKVVNKQRKAFCKVDRLIDCSNF